MSAPNTASLLQGAQRALSEGNARKAADLSRKALRYEPRNADAVYFLGLAHALNGELVPAIERWRQVLQLNPRQFAAHANLGTALWQRGEYPEAIEHLRVALAIGGSHPQMQENLAQAYYAQAVEEHRAGRVSAALANYEQSLTLIPDFAQVWRDRGRALESLQRLSDALASFERAAALAPDDTGSLAGTLSCSVRTCNWPLASRSLQQLRQLPQGLKSIHPFLALSVFEEPAELLTIASGRALSCAPRAAPKHREGRIRLAYVSSDLRDHPVAHLIVGVLEHHDRERFEVHAIALNPGADERLRLSVEHWHDVANQSDSDVAQLMRTLQIDIAVDLNGHTIGARPGIFAHRAAPVQVSYLGYAGTSGAPCMDYLLADAVVIPPEEERWYTEKVIRLPHCFLPNDAQRSIGQAPAREAAGLPPYGLVLCAFTNAYKINPPVFDIWMRLLREIPDSVLWLRAMGPEAKENLLREAASRAVDPQRLVFAPHVASIAEHLGRHQLADLYLDTLPYNAHSTACDALWAGVPVLTCTGRTFAARVATSVLTAAGLPELITKDLREYASCALQLAREPGKLRELRRRLVDQRDHCTLFDTRAYCQHLESAYSDLSVSTPARA